MGVSHPACSSPFRTYDPVIDAGKRPIRRGPPQDIKAHPVSLRGRSPGQQPLTVHTRSPKGGQRDKGGLFYRCRKLREAVDLAANHISIHIQHYCTVFKGPTLIMEPSQSPLTAIANAKVLDILIGVADL